MSCSDGTIEFEDVEVVKETDAALLVRIEGEEVWLPKSQLCEDSDKLEEGETGTIMLPSWLAFDKGLM